MNMFSLKELALQKIVKERESFFQNSPKNGYIIPYRIAEELLSRLDEEEFGIPENYIKCFLGKKAILKNVKMDGHRLSDKSYLSFLKCSYIETISIENIRHMGIKDWFHLVNGSNLRELSLKQCVFRLGNGNNSSVNLYDEFDLRSMKCLTVLNVSFTNFDYQYLNYICKELPDLEELNISSTLVDDLTPLEKLKNLKALNCSYCQDRALYLTYSSLHQLKKLEWLDLSQMMERRNEEEKISEFIVSAQWPNLQHLHMFGCWRLSPELIPIFLKNHSKLKYLGLNYSEQGSIDLNEIRQNYPYGSFPLVITELTMETFRNFLKYSLTAKKEFTEDLMSIYFKNCLAISNHDYEMTILSDFEKNQILDILIDYIVTAKNSLNSSLGSFELLNFVVGFHIYCSLFLRFKDLCSDWRKKKKIFDSCLTAFNHCVNEENINVLHLKLLHVYSNFFQTTQEKYGIAMKIFSKCQKSSDILESIPLLTELFSTLDWEELSDKNIQELHLSFIGFIDQSKRVLNYTESIVLLKELYQKKLRLRVKTSLQSIIKTVKINRWTKFKLSLRKTFNRLKLIKRK
ncbi:DgyrCDS8599 [Dimorphilus gyrociliatus]|uniref:DgyrCDS8599 n=1 Tax=Dimorphilus gyrociliatus TaxID=2664684 RepID=A0A7I8VVN1_9ANNE|nr:DgyrCDS8599 [Dimorphilus gyrociliatus]